MWNRFNGVAGSLRSNIKQIATDILQDIDEPEDEDDASPLAQREPGLWKAQQHVAVPSQLQRPALPETDRQAAGAAPADRLAALKARLEAGRSKVAVGAPAAAGPGTVSRQSEGFTPSRTSSPAAARRHTSDTALPQSSAFQQQQAQPSIPGIPGRGHAPYPPAAPIAASSPPSPGPSGAYAPSPPPHINGHVASVPIPGHFSSSNGTVASPSFVDVPLHSPNGLIGQATGHQPGTATSDGPLQNGGAVPPAPTIPPQHRQADARKPAAFARDSAPSEQTQELAQAKQQLAELQAQVALHQQQLQQAELQAAQHRGRDEASQALVQELQAELSHTQHQLASAHHAHHREQEEAVQQRVQSWEAEQQLLQAGLQQEQHLRQHADSHIQELQAELAGLQASNAELQSRAQREQQEGGREREAAAAARIPELQRRIEALTQAQGEAASAARERDEAWRQELEAQREAAEAAQAELQHRLEASQAAEQRLQESGEALERRHAASLEDRGRERDAFWLQRLQEQEGVRRELEARLDAELAAGKARGADADALGEARDAAERAREQGLAERLRADQLAQALEESAAALEASQSGAHAAEAAHESAEADLQRRLATQQAECSRLQAQVEELEAAAPPPPQPTAHAPAAGGTEPGGVAELQAQLAAASSERDTARQQLSRLKQQMVVEQEDEEEKVRWRVDAEVRLAREELQASSSSDKAELQAARGRIQQMDADLTAWESAVAARDVELANLQTALGELTYESEAAERLRGELRAVQRNLQEALGQAAAAQAAEEAAARAQQEADARAEAAQEALRQQASSQARINEEAAMLRRAVGESMKKMNALTSDSSSLIDRRIIAKLLVTYFERGQNGDVLALMARMLGLSEEDQRRVGLGQRRTGVLRSISGLPGSLVKGIVGGGGSNKAAGDSLADQWLDFLIQQAQAADAEAEAEQTASPQAPQAAGRPGSCVHPPASGSLYCTPLHPLS